MKGGEGAGKREGKKKRRRKREPVNLIIDTTVQHSVGIMSSPSAGFVGTTP